MRMVLLAAAVLVLAAPAQARALRMVDDGPALPYQASTDGRYVAWVPVADGAVQVLDTTNGRRRPAAGPAGCPFVAVGAGTLLWNCPGQHGSSGRTLDLRGGATGTLPELPFDVGNDTNSSTYAGIGRHWVRIGRAGYHSFITRYVPRGGGPERGEPAARDLVADLDVPGLYRRLCTPVVRPEVPDGNGLGTMLAPELAQVGGRSASFFTRDTAAPVERLVLQRCGHAPRTLARCPGARCGGRQPVLVAGMVAWLEGGPADEVQLHVRSLRTGRTRSVTAGPDVQLVGAAHGRVYLTQHRRLKHVSV